MGFTTFSAGDIIKSSEVNANYYDMLNPQIDNALLNTTSIDVMDLIDSPFKIVDLFTTTQSNTINPIQSLGNINLYFSLDADFRGIYIKPDGTKLYLLTNLSGATDSVRQYSFGVPFDFSTITYDSVSFTVGDQDVTPEGIFFNSTGTKMYYLGSNTDRIYQYTLSNAWDISTATYDSVSFLVSGQTNSPVDFYFGANGTKLFVISVNTIYQYTLSNAWDISTATYDSVSFSVSSQDSSIYGLFFNSTGTKLFVGGLSTGRIYQYTLSNAWDISTATYDSKNVYISNITFYGMFITNSEKSIFIIDKSRVYAYEFTTDFFLDVYVNLDFITDYFENSFDSVYINGYVQSIPKLVGIGHKYAYVRPKLYEAIPSGATITCNVSLDGGSTFTAESDINEIIDISALTDTGDLVVKINLNTDGTVTSKVSGWACLLYK